MKHTIDEIKHAARVLKEACRERKNDCWGCPLEQRDPDGWRTCILDVEWPEDWDVDLIGGLGRKMD